MTIPTYLDIYKKYSILQETKNTLIFYYRKLFFLINKNNMKSTKPNKEWHVPTEVKLEHLV
jgi:hypothetical protein